MLETYSSEMVSMIEDARHLAEEEGNEKLFVTTYHLLYAMAKNKKSICSYILEEYEINIQELKILKTNEHNTVDPVYSDEFISIIKKAEEFAKEIGSDYVYDEHVFYVFLDTLGGVRDHFLRAFHLDPFELCDEIDSIFHFYSDDELEDSRTSDFLINLKEQKEEKYYPFDDTLNELKIIIKKAKKKNCMLVGDPGIGKSAVIKKLAHEINPVIYQLDLGSILSGTKYRGEMEEKLKQAIERIEKEEAILFIDEVHTMIGAGASEGSQDLANLLKPILSNSKFTFLSATTTKEYHQYIKKDQAFLRRFEILYMKEPTNKEVTKILNDLIPFFENHYNHKVSQNDIKEVTLKSKYHLPYRNNPDKAIDILDHTLARMNCEKTSFKKALEKTTYILEGLPYKTNKEIENTSLNYPNFRKNYYNLYQDEKAFLGIEEVPNHFSLEKFYEDIENLFGLTKEICLILSTKDFETTSKLNKLLGTEVGYIGYEEGGILANHLKQYPMQILFIKEYEEETNLVKYLKHLIELKEFYDNKYQKFSFKNTLILFERKIESNKIGF